MRELQREGEENVRSNDVEGEGNRLEV